MTVLEKKDYLTKKYEAFKIQNKIRRGTSTYFVAEAYFGALLERKEFLLKDPPEELDKAFKYIGEQVRKKTGRKEFLYE